MKKLIRGAGVVALATASVLTLAACGDQIVIENVNGQGTCGGNAFTLVADQNIPGDTLTIDYTGPSTGSVGLFLGQGFYMDEITSGANNFVIGDSVPYAIKLDVTAPGWTTSGSGNSTTYSFSGSIETLLDGEQTAFDLFGTLGMGDIYNLVFPAVVGVDCDAANITGEVTTNWKAAAPLYPNHILMNALEIVSSEPITDGARVTFRYPADALTEFGAFDAASPEAFSLFADDPSLSNDSLANMWAQGLGSGYSANSGAVVTNPDGSFTVEFTGEAGSEALPDGSYLLITIVPNQDQSAAKVVFSSMTYDTTSGFVLESLPFLPEIPKATLPDTGVDSSSMAAAGLIGAGALVAGFAAVVAVRRRAHS